MTRAAISICLGFLLMILMGPIARALGLEQVTIDVALIIVVYTAMADRRAGSFRSASALGGAPVLFDGPSIAVTMVLGYFSDVLGGGSKGVFALSLALVFIGGRLLARQVYLAGPVAQVVFSFVASLLTSLLALLLRWITGPPPSLAMLMVLVAQAGLTAAAAPLLMGLLRRIDARMLERGDRLSSL